MSRPARAGGGGVETEAEGVSDEAVKQANPGRQHKGKRGAPQTFAWKLFSILDAGTDIVGWSESGECSEDAIYLAPRPYSREKPRGAQLVGCVPQFLLPCFQVLFTCVVFVYSTSFFSAQMRGTLNT